MYVCMFMIHSIVQQKYYFSMRKVTIIFKTRGEVKTKHHLSLAFNVTESSIIMNLQFLCHELFDREENPGCCKDEPEFRCWRHHLKGVSVTVEIQSQSKLKSQRQAQAKL